MDINARIRNIKKYFISFSTSVKDGANVLALSPEENWDIPSFSLKQRFKVDAVKKGDVLFLLTEIDNDSDCLFDCAEFIVEYNAELEKRTTLYKESLAKLKDLFASEPISKLETLDFVFKPRKKKPLRPKTNEEEESTEQPVQEETATPEVEETGSLMNFAQKLTGEK